MSVRATEGHAGNAWIGLGGNIGDVRTTMRAAVRRIGELETSHLAAISPLYRTPPWGDTDQPDFLNACIAIGTALEPLVLLGELKAIERYLNRVATRRWGPRTIDLDILAMEGVELSGEDLTLPHPRIGERAFVLRPLADIAAGLMIGGKSVSQLLAGLDDEPAIVPVAGPEWAGMDLVE